MIDTRLSRDERYQIAILAKANFNQSEIAKMMER
jgi:IS30 family transposase